MIEFKDYYKILELNQSASAADIKSSYKKLAKKFHPDASSGDEEKFKEVNEAYEVLKDKEKRSKYDSMYRYQSNLNKQRKDPFSRKQSPLGDFDDFMYSGGFTDRAASSKSDSSFSDFFEMLFGHYASAENAKTQNKTKKRGEDYHMELELSLEEAFHGTLRKIEISGQNKKVRRLEVTIPAHVKEGNKIKIANEGKPGQNGGSNGDLFLKVKFKEHDKWRVDAYDIHSDLELEPHEAVLGAVKTIDTINGQVDLTIPPKTQNKSKLRLKDKGLKHSKTDDFGNHYVHILIKIPENPSPEEIKRYEQIRDLKSK